MTTSTSTDDRSLLDPLAMALRQTLSHVPSQVGLRLQSEEKLATELGVGRRQVREAINELVDEGVLVRQRGSGTFVRQLPKAPSQTSKAAERLLNAQKLFASDGHRSVVALRNRYAGAISNKQVLHLGFWGNMHCSTEANLVTVRGVVETAQEMGHRLSMHSTITAPETGLPVKTLAEEIMRHPCDGYLISSMWGQLFNEAAAMAGLSSDAPRVYLAGGRADESLEPVVCPDFDKMIDRAMTLFHEQGIKRMTMLLHSAVAQHTIAKLNASLDAFVRKSGCTCQTIVEPPTFAGGMKATRQLFATNPSDPKPQGLFVFDSRMLEGVVETMHMLDKIPGRDVGMIVLANRGVALTGHYDWSRLEHDPVQMGRLAVQMLLQQLSEPDQQLCSLMLYPRWVAGQTHTCTHTGDQS